MSQKIQAFTQIITTPQNVHNFSLTFEQSGPLMPQSLLNEFNAVSVIVQSTSMPSDQMRSTTLYAHGEEIRWPAVPQNSGNWGFNIPESDTGAIGVILQRLRTELWDPRTGALSANALQWFNVRVTANDLNSQANFSTLLHGCWLLGRQDVNLSQQNPEQNWKWDYQLRYQWLEVLNHK
jgi:hypothetical protein